MTLKVAIGDPVVLHLAVFQIDGVTPYTGLIDGDFTKILLRDGVSSGVTPTVVEVGSTGVYSFSFTPNAAGFWWAQSKASATEDWWGEPIHVTPNDVGGQVAEAQCNVAYNEDTTTLYLEVWLDRDGSSVDSGLVSCEVKGYDATGTLLFTESSSSPKVDGRFSLSTILALDADLPYNLTVTVTDGDGSVTTFQAFTTAG